MKTLIVYMMNHHGTTRKVAEWLQGKFGPQTSAIVNLRNDAIPPLNKYSTILIIGDTIHVGQMQKKVQRFCKLNLTTLLQKNIGLLLCCMNEENGEKEFNNVFPAQLKNHSLANGLFERTFIFSEMNFMEQMLVKSIPAKHENRTTPYMSQMLEFVKTIKESTNISERRITGSTNKSWSYFQVPQ